MDSAEYSCAGRITERTRVVHSNDSVAGEHEDVR